MIVSHDESRSAPIAEVLIEAGIPTIAARDGVESLIRLDSGAIRVVLLRLDLEDMPGLELITHIKELDARIQIFALVGNPGVDRILEALRKGAVDVMNESNEARIIHAVYEALARFSSWKSLFGALASTRVREFREHITSIED